MCHGHRCCPWGETIGVSGEAPDRAYHRWMSAAGIFLTPGAGSNRDQMGLVALADHLSPLPVKRMDFVYRIAGRPFPDRAPKLVDEVREGVAAMAADLGVESGDLVLGGRSMGGRICSMAVAGGLPACGLVLISYPLHPPRKPENLRVDHFPDIDVPCLFVSGDRDEFGSPEEFDKHLPAISGQVTMVWIPKKRHDLRDAEDAVCEVVEGWLDGL